MSFTGGTPPREAPTATISYFVADHLCCLWVSFCWRSSAKLSNHYFFFCPFFCSSSAAKGTQCGIHTGRTELCFIKGDNFDESGIIVEAAAAKTWPSDISLRKLWIKSEPPKETRKETRSPLFKPNFPLTTCGAERKKGQLLPAERRCLAKHWLLSLKASSIIHNWLDDGGCSGAAGGSVRFIAK